MEERARRVRSLLEGYYGTGGEAGAVAGPESSAAKSDINSKGFEAESYMSSMLRTSKMEDLLHQHVSWAAEIKNLDSDMQMLVYENYSKFISATDTIRKMKDNLGGMEATMERLLQNVTSVQEKSDSVNGSLCERRERIEQLNGTRSLLRKAQYIFDLPKRLRHFVASQNYKAAVQSYLGSLPILESYGETSFQSVREEADEVMAEVIRQLQQHVTSDQFSFEQRALAATLLQQLNQPVEELMDSYLALHWERLLGQLREAAEAASRAREAGHSPEGAVQQSLVDTLNRDFVEDFERTASNFRGIFPMGDDKLTASTRDLFNEYVGHVQKTMQGAEETSTKASDLMFALRNLSRDVSKMAEQVPGASLAERAAEAMEGAARQHIVQGFALHELRVKDQLEGLAKPMKAAGVGGGSSLGMGSSSSLRTAVGAAAPDKLHSLALQGAESSILDATLSLLEELSKLLDPGVDLLVPFHDDLVRIIHAELTHFFHALHVLFLALAGLPPPGSHLPGVQPVGTPAALVLLLSRLAQLLSSSAIAKISATVDSLFPFPDARLDSAEDDAHCFHAHHFSALFSSASEKLLQQYVDLEGKKLCIMIGKSVTTPNWLKYKEPKEVRMVVDLILQEVESIRQVTGQILADSSAAADGRAGGSSRATGTGGLKGSAANARGASSSTGGSRARARSRVLERDVAKLFKQKVEIFTRLEFSQASVMSTLVKMLLKSFQECVRLQTFGRNGYQQIQLDALSLCEALRPLLEEETVVDMLMDEVCTAAAERSLDPTPMDASAIDRVLQSRRDRRGFS